ncbi:MAG: hypothetical protein WD009_00115, partial [Phycisphaeraceae bacterium]
PTAAELAPPPPSPQTRHPRPTPAAAAANGRPTLAGTLAGVVGDPRDAGHFTPPDDPGLRGVRFRTVAAGLLNPYAPPPPPPPP